MPTIRLLSVDARSLTPDEPAVASLISAESPDVVCVHGAPSLLRWRSRCAALAREAGLVVVSGGRTGGGNLLLSTLGIDVVTTRDVLFGATSVRRSAGATLALLRHGDSPFVAVAAGLAGDASRQAGQVDQLQAEVEAITALGEPAGLSGAPSVLSIAGAIGAGASVLSQGRAAVGDRAFVDERITVDNLAELTERRAARCLQLSLPAPVPRDGLA